MKNKLLISTSLVMGLAFSYAKSAMALDPLATPTGEAVVGGSSSISRPGAGLLDVTQTTNRSIINWDSFDIGTDAKVQFFQPGPSSLSIERVTNGNPSQILGSLKANGNVMILNPNGILFGKDSTVDVNGLVASAGDVSDSQVMSGENPVQISNMGAGTVENEGNITVGDMGLTAFIAPTVKNSGTITANLGKVALGAGERATVDFTGDGLISIAVDSNLTRALVENSGAIKAHGGQVTMTARTAAGIIDNVVNNTGVVEASSMIAKGGEIILVGGDRGQVSNSGTLSASGKTAGGRIAVSGYNIDASGIMNAESVVSGQGGSISIAGDQDARVDGIVKASGIEGGGSINISGRGLAVGNAGYIVAESTGSGQGGDIALNGTNSVDIAGLVKASGIGAGGNISIAGQNLTVNDSGYVVAEAVMAGSGGTITLDGEDDTSLQGVVKATGIDDGGTINIAGRTISVGETSAIVAEATNTGTGGDIFLAGTNDIQLYGTLKAGGIDHGGTIVAQGDKIYTDASTVMKAKGPDTFSVGGLIGLTADTLLEIAGGHVNTQDFNMSSPVVNFSGDTRIRNADLSLDADIVNLSARILNYDGTPIIDSSRIASNAPAVNVLSDAALVQQGIYLAGNGANVTVSRGNYLGEIIIDRPLTLQGDGSSPTLSVAAPRPAVVTIAADDVTIRGFNIDAKGSAANILLTGNDDIQISNNTILDGEVGIDASGFGNGNVALSGNQFFDNTLGVQFGSGRVDLTGAGNIFSGGATAMLFERATSGAQTASLSLVSNTLGSIVFTGQSGANTGKQYVDLENGAFFAPGNPTLIDGTGGTYDGVRGGSLTISQQQAIENRLHDYDDDRTVGQIFVTPFISGGQQTSNLTIPQIDPLQRPIISVADKVINYSPPFEPIETLTLDTDVSIKMQTPAPVFQNPTTLANISPAAGGEEAETAQELAKIEPAAGGRVSRDIVECGNNFLDNKPCESY